MCILVCEWDMCAIRIEVCSLSEVPRKAEALGLLLSLLLAERSREFFEKNFLH